MPKDKPHSFLVKLDGSDIRTQIVDRMGEHVPREPTPRHSQDVPLIVNPTGDLINDTIRATDNIIQNKISKAGAQNKAAGTNGQMAGASILSGAHNSLS